ncbi:MAG: sulfatase-like hydrolase/transferase [Verrucomicrobiota bacterium]
MSRIFFASLLLFCLSAIGHAERPNIVLVMTDDQGWGQTGYQNHPLLKTPNLDAMAGNGLRFDRFYAAAPVCSPTRASVFTGRNNDRTGVFSHGYALRNEEKTLGAALRDAGYATGHFGKWHLNGLRGVGAPVLGDDPHSPGAYGFDTWITVTNFFDFNPLMGHDDGEFREYQGESSEIIVDQALRFMEANKESGKPFFVVIWYGSPHDPFEASEEDRAPFASLPEAGQHHYGELVAVDRSVGTLRRSLREMGMAEDTIVWFNSDNGGLSTKRVGMDSVGGLRGNKGSLYEGGIRVPGIIEWPSTIQPRITNYPASTMDIMPTLLDILELGDESMNEVVDGVSLVPVFSRELEVREKAIPFHYSQKSAALIDNDWKILKPNLDRDEYELYHLGDDPGETNNLVVTHQEQAARMTEELEQLTVSVARSIAGEDYPGGIVHERTERQFWHEDPRYAEYLPMLLERPEYERYLPKDKKQK